MFPFPIAKPQGCDIQTFYGVNTPGSTNRNARTWNKPIGVSHVYMMLIGGGGDGDTLNGGGSGAVTVWYGAAQHVPDSLVVTPGRSGVTSSVVYRSTASSTYTLVSANGGSTPTAATATTATAFAASGFYKSTAGQDGGNGSDPGPSSTTFLGGGQRAQLVITGNYGYGINNNVVGGIAQGFFQLQPIIVGVGSGPNDATGAGLPGAIGCGGGGNNGGTQFPGGPGMVLIASW